MPWLEIGKKREEKKNSSESRKTRRMRIMVGNAVVRIGSSFRVTGRRANQRRVERE